MAENISYKKITKADSDYLGEWDLPIDGSDAVFTIVDAKQERITLPSIGLVKDKLVITFEETNKKFVCNDTNGGLITKALGSANLAEWVGKRIQLYSNHKVKFGKDLVSAIRVRPVAPTTSEPEYHCSVCGKVINKSTYDGSITKYGKAYCSGECLNEDKNGKDVL